MFKCLFVSVSSIFCNLFILNVVRRYKWHIVMITLIPSLACCAIVFYPSVNKHFLSPFRQVPLKFFDNRLEFWKFGTEERINLCVFRPIYREGIKSLDLGQNLVPERFSSSDKGIVTLHIKRKSIDNQSHNESTTNAEQPEIRCGESDPEDYHLLWSLLPMYIVTIIGSLYMFFIVAQR